MISINSVSEKYQKKKLETVHDLTVSEIEINLMILFHIHDVQTLYQYNLFPRKGKKLSDFFIWVVFIFHKVQIVS